MIEVACCPSLLLDGFTTYSPKAVKSLFDGRRADHVLDFNIEDFRNTEEIVQAMNRISVSGVQEKFPAVVDGGKIRISNDGERSTHILKPAPWDETICDRVFIPANEHLTMQIASQVYGVVTAYNGLCFTEKGRSVYITKRFDVLPDGSKHVMEDFAAVIGKNEKDHGENFKYDACFEDIADAIKENVPAWKVDMERFFNLVVFNYIYANGDDHLKNFSLIIKGEDYRLAPAYDLLNTALHVGPRDFGLDGGLSPNIYPSDVYDRTGHPCRLDFERFADRIGIMKSRAAKILDMYMSMPEKAQELVERSFLPDKLKRKYLRIVNERIARFVRKSE